MSSTSSGSCLMAQTAWIGLPPANPKAKQTCSARIFRIILNDLAASQRLFQLLRGDHIRLAFLLCMHRQLIPACSDQLLYSFCCR